MGIFSAAASVMPILDRLDFAVEDRSKISVFSTSL